MNAFVSAARVPGTADESPIHITRRTGDGTDPSRHSVPAGSRSESATRARGSSADRPTSVKPSRGQSRSSARSSIGYSGRSASNHDGASTSMASSSTTFASSSAPLCVTAKRTCNARSITLSEKLRASKPKRSTVGVTATAESRAIAAMESRSALQRSRARATARRAGPAPMIASRGAGVAVRRSTTPRRAPCAFVPPITSTSVRYSYESHGPWISSTRMSAVATVRGSSLPCSSGASGRSSGLADA